MRQLWPNPADAAGGGDRPPGQADELLEDLDARREWVGLNFVTAVDGAVTIAGRSGPLGGRGDRAMFRALRDHSDVVMVGAGTARAENYGPTSPRAASMRHDRGQAPRPALVVVTRSGDLSDLDRLWADPGMQVVVAAGSDLHRDRAEALTTRGAEVVVSDGPAGGPDLDEVIDLLRARGLGRILCEGGPHLAADLLAAGLVTDMFTTVSPLVVGGTDTMVTPRLAVPRHLALAAVRMHGDEVFLHHRVTGPLAAEGGDHAAADDAD